MCSSESCLGYILIFILLFYFLLIYFLLKYRKNILKKDLLISADQLWNEFKKSFSTREIIQSHLIYSILQDKNITTASLVIKNNLDEVIGQVEFPTAAREYKVLIQEQVYKIVINLTWGGSSYSLYSPHGLEIAQLKRKSLSPKKHTVTIFDFGTLTSHQPLFNFKAPIEYSLDNNPIAFTSLISSSRRIGRIGCFSNEISLPVKIFILSMTS